MGWHRSARRPHQKWALMRDALGLRASSKLRWVQSCACQITFARIRSLVLTAPTSTPSASTTSSTLMRWAPSGTRPQQPARRREWCGAGVITSPASTVRRSTPASILRRKSPSVKMPPHGHGHRPRRQRPGPWRSSRSSVHQSRLAGMTRGTAAPERITSRRWVSSLRPSEPPGWERAKSSS